ncbi:hypothetical protein CLU79DRAFT_838851 [Phycomyces nitens]|nr:hypothetical protein CLU79DRAFT_838851 [Phycomyces nitens]
MTEENCQRCLALLEQGDMEVIYVEELGDRRPFALAKQAVMLDPVYLLKYPDYPQPAPTPSPTSP